jgi:HEAT repeat protein
MLALVNDEAQTLQVVKLAIDDVSWLLALKLTKKLRTPCSPLVIEWLNGKEMPVFIKILLWGHTRYEEAVPFLEKVLENENQEPEIIQAAIKSLGKIGSESAAVTLAKFLWEDSVVSEYQEIPNELRRIGSKVAIDLLENAPRRSLKHSRLEDRRQRNKSKKQRKATDYIDDQALKSKQENQEDLVKLEEFLEGLNQLDPIEVFIESLDNQDFMIRAWSAEVLGEIGDKQATKALAKTLSDYVPDVGASAAEALGKIGCHESIKVLKKAVNHRYLEVGFTAIKALEEIGSNDAIETLVEAL